MLTANQIATRLKFTKFADELPEPLPGPAGDPGLSAAPVPPVEQSSTGPGALTDAQIENLRQVLLEAVGDEGEAEVFQASKKLPPEPKVAPSLPAGPPIPSDQEASEIFRGRTPEDDERAAQIGPDASTVNRKSPLGPAPYRSKRDPKTELYFSEDEPRLS